MEGDFAKQRRPGTNRSSDRHPTTRAQTTRRVLVYRAVRIGGRANEHHAGLRTDESFVELGERPTQVGRGRSRTKRG
jgi:hypothetical protein